MASEWEEVKRLAADLQRVQLSSTNQRLSERNCIEIVSKLIELRLLDVIFTSDGKEYLTPQQVLKEIKDELYEHGGRINLADLSRNLNVDFSQIEARTSELLRNDNTLTLVLGQLIEKDYLDRLAEEVNERLQQNGIITVGELTKEYDLPSEFIQQNINRRLGTLIHAQTDSFDSKVLFTETYIKRQRAQILGALSAVTRPTPILNIINYHNFQERIFHTVAEELLEKKQLAGIISGGRQERAVYIPDIYSKAQKEWVDNFYKQNGYLEYDALIRLGVTEPQTFIKKQFKNENLFYLNTCAVGQSIFDLIEAAVDEALITGDWVDIMPILPSVCSNKDGHQLLQTVLKGRNKHSSQAFTFCDTIVCSEKFILDIKKSFDDLMITKAEKDAHKGVGLGSRDAKLKMVTEETRKDKREERRKKAAGGKSGGGTQGRETKTKAVKKKYRQRDSDESEDDEDVVSKSKSNQDVEFLTPDEITEVLGKQKQLEECPPELLNDIAFYLHRPLNKSYQEVVKSVILASAAATAVNRRKTHSDLQDKMNALLTNIRLFEKGLKLFADDTQEQLSKHLLKTLGTDATNLVFSYLSQEHMLVTGTGEEKNLPITSELRLKLINKLPQEMQEPLSKLNSSVNGKSVDEFLGFLENVLGPGICDVVIKKLDKKKERQVAFGHRQALLEQLSSTMDSALTLHLIALILFQLNTHCMLHASGKFVPQILLFLESYLPKETIQLLQTYQGLVIKQLTLSDEEQLGEVKIQLEELLPKVKEVAITTKRGSQSDKD